MKRFRPLNHVIKRNITWMTGTEGLKRTKDPTLRKNIEAVEKADEKTGIQTIVHTNGILPYYKHSPKQISLPRGHDDPVAASHEFQHAYDFNYVMQNQVLTQETLEMRAFKAQKKTADFLGLDDGLNGMSPSQRAKTHSQVKNSQSDHLL